MLYKSFSYNEVKSIAEKHTHVIVKETESGILLFMQQGARLLGMFPDVEGDNVLWVNENLEACLKEHHAMVGGERLWISPERNFYYENPRDFEGYHIPYEIDPGEYEYIDDTQAVIFKNTFSLLEYDRNKLFDNSHEKRQFKLIPDPFTTKLPYAGVSITDEIMVHDLEIDMCVWSIAQVYTCGPESPGTALFPVKPECKLISYFDPIPPDRGETFEQYARFKIDGSYSIKLGIRPEDTNFDTPCKGVYLSCTPTKSSIWSCVIKRSNDLPRSQKDCVDMAKSDPDGPKGAIQAFNTDHGSSEPAAFPCGELGLQLTKGVAEDNKTVSRATHELLGYTGTKDEMLDLAKSVLQIETTPELY